MSVNLDDHVEIKAAIRAILMALGRRATEKEFRSSWFDVAGESFNSVLRQTGMSFFEFLKSIPDVCHVFKFNDDEIFVEMVSAKKSSHMDTLTVIKNQKRSKPRFRPVPRFSVFRPMGRPQPCFQPYQQYCAPAPSRRLGINSTAAPASSRTVPVSTRPVTVFAPPKPQPFGPPKPRLFVPIQKKPAAKSAPANNLPLPLHMLMKTINFGSSADEQEEKVESPEEVPEEIKPEDNLNKSTISSCWSDEKSPPRKPVLKFNRFRLRLTDSIKSIESKQVAKSLPEELEEKFPHQKLSKSETVTANPKTGTGNIRQALQNSQNDSQHLEEKPRQTSVANDYITGEFAIPQPHIKTIKCLTSFEVTVVNIKSPSQFGFTFSQNQLQLLQVEMEIHYSVEIGIVLKDPVVGMPVAVPLGDKWYRAEILYVNPSDVLILFVDTGIRKYVNTAELRYLKKEFASVTRKACKGRLFGVQPDPTSGQWSTEAMAVFSQKTKNAKLRATVKAFKDGVYELSLLNESDGKTRVAEHLVSIGLAEKVAEADSSLAAILV